MTFRNLQTAASYATLTAAIAALPDPLDQSYSLEEQDQATYVESPLSIDMDTAGFVLTIQGRPGLRPMFTPASSGGKGGLFSSILDIADPALRVTLRDINFGAEVNIISNPPGVRSYILERCTIITNGSGAVSCVDAGPGPGGGVPGLWLRNCVFASTSGQPVWLEGDQYSLVEHCTISSFNDVPPAGANNCVYWVANPGAPEAKFQNCLFRYSDSGSANSGLIRLNNLGVASLTGDGNLFHLRTGTEPYGWNEDTATAIATFATWQAATGADALSIEQVDAFPDAAMYADEAGRDYSLAAGASAIDAVVPAYEGLTAWDVDNQARPVAASSDIGAYEYVASAAAPVLDVLVLGDRPVHLDASGWIAASGATGRRDRLASATRSGPGVYALAFELGRDRDLSEFDVGVQALAPVARAVTLQAQGQQLTVRTFDAAGNPADTNFSLAIRRL